MIIAECNADTLNETMKRNESISLRGKILRLRKNDVDDEIARDELKKTRKELKKHIHNENKKEWVRVCNEVDK